MHIVGPLHLHIPRDTEGWLYNWKNNNTYMWTRAAQACAVQGSIVLLMCVIY